MMAISGSVIAHVRKPGRDICAHLFFLSGQESFLSGQESFLSGQEKQVGADVPSGLPYARDVSRHRHSPLPARMLLPLLLLLLLLLLGMMMTFSLCV
jgi:hypothetical protein